MWHSRACNYHIVLRRVKAVGGPRSKPHVFRQGCGSRRLHKQTSTGWSPRALWVVGGAAAFVGADVALEYTFSQLDIRSPPAIAGLAGLGLVCGLSPRTGAILYSRLSGGAAWLRGGLVVFLVPSIAMPLVVEPPSPAMFATIAAGALATMALVGHVFARGLAGRVGTVDIVQCARTSRECRSAASLLCDPRFAAVAMGAGAACSFTAALANGGAISEVAGPLLVGATVATYVGCSLIVPCRLHIYLPPTITASLVVGGGLASAPSAARLLIPADGSTTTAPAVAQAYLDGAGAALLRWVSPAMITLGLYGHTHRAMIIRYWKPLLAACAIGAPLAIAVQSAVGLAVDLTDSVSFTFSALAL